MQNLPNWSLYPDLDIDYICAYAREIHQRVRRADRSGDQQTLECWLPELEQLNLHIRDYIIWQKFHG